MTNDEIADLIARNTAALERVAEIGGGSVKMPALYRPVPLFHEVSRIPTSDPSRPLLLLVNARDDGTLVFDLCDVNGVRLDLHVVRWRDEEPPAWQQQHPAANGRRRR